MIHKASTQMQRRVGYVYEKATAGACVLYKVGNRVRSDDDQRIRCDEHRVASQYHWLAIRLHRVSKQDLSMRTSVYTTRV